MNNSSRKKQFGMNIGSASILLVFVILCLVSFAVLSIVSANADSKLSARVLERTTAYYAACNQAEQSLAGMDKTLQRMYASSDSEEAYFVAVGHGKSYVIPISDLQTLQVTISKFRKVVFFCHGYKLHRFNYFIVWLKKYPNITSQK